MSDELIHRLRYGCDDGARDEAADMVEDQSRQITSLREEVMHLRMYAPGQRQAHAITMAPHVGPTNWRYWGLAEAEKDFDSFGRLVPNESEA